jgi:Zn-dependent peptidase ImmA (M78 family)
MNEWQYGVKVPPRRIADLRSLATRIRAESGLDRQAPFPALHFLELSMPRMFNNFDLEIVDELTDGDEARAYPDGAPHHPHGPVIQLRFKTYDDASGGNGRARMTVLHECGHVTLHAGVAVTHDTHDRGERLNPWENSEWQANQFAAELLMPPESLGTASTVSEFALRMGVSRDAARVRAQQLVRTTVISKPEWLS